jgi:hypothetical protein
VSDMLDRGRIVALLGELAGRLNSRGLEADLYVVGGTAMALAYDRLRVTRDIDAVGEPMAVIEAEAREMAAIHRDLPADWLSARVMPLLPRSFDADRIEALAWPGLTVNVASPRRLLAMKVRAGRYDRDLQDIWVLCQVLELVRLDQVWDIVEEVWGSGMLRDDVALLVGDYLRARGLRDEP